MTGSVIVHWKKDQIKNTLIPLLDSSRQKELGRMMRDSSKIKYDAKNLLNQAFRMVGESIEGLGTSHKPTVNRKTNHQQN